jgi:hypothetical protein
MESDLTASRTPTRPKTSSIRDLIASSSRILCAALVGSASLGCAPPPEDGVEGQSEAVTNGTDVPASDVHANSVVHMATNSACTGVLLGGRWVLTAGHCGTSPTAFVERQTGGGPFNSTAQFFYPGNIDAAVYRLEGVFPNTPLQMIYPDANASFANKTVDIYGFGGTGWPHNPNKASFPITAAATNQLNGYYVTPNSAGQAIVQGDSGGPGWVGNYLAGITSGIDGSTPPRAGQVSLPYLRAWMDSTFFSGVTDMHGASLFAPTLTSGGSADGSDALRAFAVGVDGRIYVNRQRASDRAWLGWGSSITPPPGGVTGDLASITHGDGNISLFARAGDNGIWARGWFTATQTWGAWTPRGGVFTSGIAAAIDVSHGAEYLLGRRQDGRLDFYTSNFGNWNVDVPGVGITTDTPAIGVTSNGDMELFVRGNDNAIWHRTITFNGFVVYGWESLGGNNTSGPAVTTWAPGSLTTGKRIDVFALQTNGQLFHRVFSDGWWTEGWLKVPNQVAAGKKPAAFSGPTTAPRIDVIEALTGGSSTYHQAYMY